MLLAGRVGEACEAALTAIALDPLRESAVRLLIDVHLRGGNTVEAVRCYRRFSDLLSREIGADPSPALVAMIAGHLSSGSLTAVRAKSRRRDAAEAPLRRRGALSAA
jgi:DNA-binding SARP family transcriptional activator